MEQGLIATAALFEQTLKWTILKENIQNQETNSNYLCLNWT